MTDWDIVDRHGFNSHAVGINFRAYEVPALGDCAVHAVISALRPPMFLDHDSCRTTVFNWAEGEGRSIWEVLYNLFGEPSQMSFEAFLQAGRRPGVWLGTVFFLFFFL
jgi:hypothetical protein